MEELRLYYSPTCPYCRRVFNYLERKNLTLELFSTESDENWEYLIEHGGKDQVPCLFIGKDPLYESADIIRYLKEHIVQKPSN